MNKMIKKPKRAEKSLKNAHTRFISKLISYRHNPAALLMFSFVSLCALITVGALVYLLAFVLVQGVPHVITEIVKLFEGQPSLFSLDYNSDNQSLVHALINTVTITVTSVAISSVFGIFTAIYLVEYAKKGNKVVEIIRITAETLSGIPSIIYGLFGSIFFVRFLGLGISLWSGVATVSIMTLPLMIRSTEEALMSVPDSYREASFGLGAGKLRTVFKVVLPAAVPGILAGVILAIGRVVGETAALLYTSGTASRLAEGLGSSGRTLSIHMYMLTGEGMYFNQAFATAVVLLLLVLLINGLSALVAKRLMKGQ